MRTGLVAHVPTAQLDQFIALEKGDKIDDKIVAKAREVDGLKEIDNLRNRALLQALDVPPVPGRLEEIRGKTLERVSRDAETTVKKHLAKHGLDEDWLSTGLKHVQDDCPFCGQKLKGLDLTAAYRTFFNAEYDKFRLEQQQYRALPGRHYSDDKIALLNSRLETNASSAEVWKRYVTFTEPELRSNVASGSRRSAPRWSRFSTRSMRTYWRPLPSRPHIAAPIRS